jgi:hypothetical protein
MVETATQIEAHIEETRHHLGANLDALERKVKSATDWREHFQSSPLTIAGAAFAGGLVLAMATGARRDRRRARLAPSVESAPRTRGPQAEEVVRTLDNVKGALIGMAAMKLKELVGQILPGFQAEFERRQGSRSEAGRATMQPRP